MQQNIWPCKNISNILQGYWVQLCFPKQFLMVSVWDVDWFAELRLHILSPAVAVTEPRTLVARRVTEVAQSTLDMVSTAVDYPLCECYLYTHSVWTYTRELYCLCRASQVVFKHLVLSSGFVKGVARPDYWIPDHEIIQCHSCTNPSPPACPSTTAGHVVRECAGTARWRPGQCPLMAGITLCECVIAVLKAGIPCDLAVPL